MATEWKNASIIVQLLLYSVHVELAPQIMLIYCTIHRYTPYAIDFSLQVHTCTLPYPFMFQGAKLLAASTSAVEWYKSHTLILFLSES